MYRATDVIHNDRLTADFDEAAKLRMRIIDAVGTGGSAATTPNRAANNCPPEDAPNEAENPPEKKVGKNFHKPVEDAGTGNTLLQRITRDGAVDDAELEPLKDIESGEIKSEAKRLEEIVAGNEESQLGRLQELYELPTMDDLETELTRREQELARFPEGSPGRPTKEAAVNELRSTLEDVTALENDTADGVKNKLLLAGTYDAQIRKIESGDPEISSDGYQELRERAQPFIDMFNSNDGQDYSPDGAGELWLGDDWDTNTEYTFDKMVEQFAGKPDKIDEWAEHQDNDHARAAVEELSAIMREYEGAENSVNDNVEQVEALTELRNEVLESAERDLGMLSESTISRLQSDLSGETVDSGETAENGDVTTTTEVESGQTESPETGGAEAGGQQEDTTSGPDTGIPYGGSGTQPSEPAISIEQIIANHKGLGDQYTVQEGDWLDKIATTYNAEYGTSLTWNDIHSANAGVIADPNTIYTGQQLTIPGVRERLEREQAEITSMAVNGAVGV